MLPLLPLLEREVDGVATATLIIEPIILNWRVKVAIVGLVRLCFRVIGM